MNALLLQYGLPWKWKSTPREDGGFDVFNRACFYEGFMRAHGVPELTSIFWSLDSLWMDRITPKRCGFSLQEQVHDDPDERWCRSFAFTPATG